MSACSHQEVRCLNQFELIRKYQCTGCGVVMMCMCDEHIGRQSLPHQLSEGSELETRRRYAVTGGFVANVCDACRGLEIQAHPVASIHGRTSKIKRYYWRELAFREMDLFAEWATGRGLSPMDAAGPDAIEAHKRFRQQALAEIKALHRDRPKYTFASESQTEVLRECSVTVLELDAIYLRETGSKKAKLLFDDAPVTAEEYVRRHFEATGYSVLDLESRPFHALFGIYMWLLVQDAADPNVRLVGFGDRNAFETGEGGRKIWTHLPEDFGTPGYSVRRAEAIDEHLTRDMSEEGELEWLFDYWLPYSADLRQYLWAHRAEDVAKARSLISILSADRILQILRYLVDDYWGRYLGWPDLLIYRGAEYRMVEVKSSSDKLSDDQKRWIRDNHEILKLPFELVKLRKKEVRDLD